MQRLFENIEINWDALALPGRTSEEGRLAPESCAGLAPSLRGVRAEDLASVASLEVLYGQAVAQGILADSEANFLGFLSTAAYCRRVGDDPPALFAHFIRNRHYPATLEDEDRAISAVKQGRSVNAEQRPRILRRSSST